MPKLGMEPVRRAETINAALECFCEFGIEKTTLDMVAGKAGFSKGIVSYYFKTKKQLTLECLKAFMKSYKLKIGSSITREMTPMQMVKRIVEISLPPISIETGETINVSILDGVDKIRLPENKIASLFIQFISKASNDEEWKTILREIYTDDVEGISFLIMNAKKAYGIEDLDDKQAAYSLLAMVYGLSFFRVTGFMPPGEVDNRNIAINYLEHLFKSGL